MGNVRLLLQGFLGLAMAAIIWGAFLWARPAANFVGQSSRIVFFHVPQAWVASLAYVAAVNIIIWAGIFFYLVYLDRKVRAASRHLSPEERP